MKQYIFINHVTLRGRVGSLEILPKEGRPLQFGWFDLHTAFASYGIDGSEIEEPVNVECHLSAKRLRLSDFPDLKGRIVEVRGQLRFDGDANLMVDVSSITPLEVDAEINTIGQYRRQGNGLRPSKVIMEESDGAH